MGSLGKCIIKNAGLDNKKLFEDFYALSNSELYLKYGYSANAIRRHLILNEYDMIDKGKENTRKTRENILKLWKSGVSVKKISEELGISDDCIYENLKKSNIDYKNINKDLDLIHKNPNENFMIYKNTNYAVSNFGRVYSFYSKRFLKLHEKDGINLGYRYVVLSDGQYSVHRLVAELFVENKNKYKEVNHIDMNRRNNHFSNLEWCTRSQNIKHMLSNKENYDRSVERARTAGMKNAKKVKCLNDGIIFESISDAKRQYSINGAEQISRVCVGKNSYVKDSIGRKLNFVFIGDDCNE